MASPSQILFKVVLRTKASDLLSFTNHFKWVLLLFLLLLVVSDGSVEISGHNKNTFYLCLWLFDAGMLFERMKLWSWVHMQDCVWSLIGIGWQRLNGMQEIISTFVHLHSTVWMEWVDLTACNWVPIWCSGSIKWSRKRQRNKSWSRSKCFLTRNSHSIEKWNGRNSCSCQGRLIGRVRCEGHTWVRGKWSNLDWASNLRNWSCEWSLGSKRRRTCWGESVIVNTICKIAKMK